MSLSKKKIFICNAIIALIIIISSFFFEFYYLLTPCKLCLIQRYMWVIFFILSLLGIFHTTNKKIISLFFFITLFLLFLISLYHSAIEAGLIENIFSCTISTGFEASSIEELSNIIVNTENNDCAFPKFSFYGLTLTNLSLAGSLIMLLINLQVMKNSLFNKYGRKTKNS